MTMHNRLLINGRALYRFWKYLYRSDIVLKSMPLLSNFALDN